MPALTLAEFKSTLQQSSAPAGISMPLRALWEDARGNWERAHEIAQDIDDKTGAWIHAYLHRKEGDEGNAAGTIPAACYSSKGASGMKLTAFTAIAVAGVIGVAQAQQAVTWTNNQNVAVRGGGLQKTGGCEGCDDAGAASQQMIGSGNGFAEFTVGEDYSFWMAGLSRRNTNASFRSIEFGIRLNGNGSADVVESGRYVGGDTQYAAGDTFRIEVLDGRVQYLRNGDLIHVSQKPVVYPLVLDVSLGSLDSTVRNARIATRETDAVASDWSGFRQVTGWRAEFNALDRNKDRNIGRNEWRGNRRTFDERDINRDGVISRAEFSADAPDAVGTSGQVITVNSSQLWTDTGINVQAGSAITFDADGTIQMSTGRNDVATPAGSRRTAYDAPLWQASAGSLIARIGNSAPFLVGANSRLARAPVNGRLFLGVNDDHLADNRGEYRVTVTVEPR